MDYLVKKDSFVVSWLRWHFVEGTLFLLNAWKNILLFNLRFFSISFLIKTLFAYWHRYRWHYDRGFNISKYMEVVVSNTISRILGAFMRVSLIILGVLVEVLILIAGSLVILLWISLPVITVLIFILSFRLVL